MFESLLIGELFTFLLIFCRVGSGIMLMPGIAEMYVSPRIRLFVALSISFLLVPVLRDYMPAFPSQPLMLVTLMTMEILIGLFFGTLCRIIVGAIHTAGTSIATQSGLATAMMLDFTQTSQSTSLSNLLSITAITLIFAANLHHVILMAIVQSYDLFTPGHWAPVADFTTYAVQSVSKAFMIGIQISGPQIIVGLILNLSAGILSRLMPQMQIFFILMAPQIMLGLFVLMITITGSMLWYLDYLNEAFSQFISLK